MSQRLSLSDSFSKLFSPTNKESENEFKEEETMSTTYANSKFSATPEGGKEMKKAARSSSTSSSTSSSSSPTLDLSNVDAAEVVYSKAKDVWAWGKTVPVVGFFVSTTEKVTGKALGVVGTDFGSLDSSIATELAKVDSSYLNPAIAAIAKIVIDVAGKSEETLKPMLDVLLSKIGLIKSEANEATPDAHPEVTPQK